MSKFSIMRLLVAAVPCLMISSVYAGNATSEHEPNDPIAGAMKVVNPASETIHADLGNNGYYDLDYYTIQAKAGEVFNVDIDNGIGGTRSVDTYLAIFDSGYNILRYNNDSTTLDPGSISTKDAYIAKFVAPKAGTYIVGVSNYPRRFVNGGGVLNPWFPASGDYDLVISDAAPKIKQIAILVKPGSNTVSPLPLNPKSHGKIPVAILGGPDFDVKTIDTKSLTFGSDGTEASLSMCNREPVDLNGDGRPDLLCHFDTQKAQFKRTDGEGKLKGETKKGVKFEGTGFLKVMNM